MAGRGGNHNPTGINQWTGKTKYGKIGTVADRQGERYDLFHRVGRSEKGPESQYGPTHHYEVLKGELSVATATVPVGRHAVDNVDVIQSRRRRGIATSLYNAIESHLGETLTRGDQLMPDGQKFWQARDQQFTATRMSRADARKPRR